MSQSTQGSAAANPAPPRDRATSFEAVGEGTELRSGEKLLVEAYAAIWLVLFVMVFLWWQRQKKTDERIVELESALARVRDQVDGPGAARSSKSAKAGAAE